MHQVHLVVLNGDHRWQRTHRFGARREEAASQEGRGLVVSSVVAEACAAAYRSGLPGGLVVAGAWGRAGTRAARSPTTCIATISAWQSTVYAVPRNGRVLFLARLAEALQLVMVRVPYPVHDPMTLPVWSKYLFGRSLQ